MHERSRPGEVPTFHERDLLAHCDGSGVSDAMAVWATIAKKIGLQAVLEIFDTFGREKIHIPSREAFFDALWRPQRNRLLRKLREEGKNTETIAGSVGMTRQGVEAVLANERADSGGAGVVKGAR